MEDFKWTGKDREVNRSRLGESSGFTLLELVLATVISALVIGILSSVLSFSLRVWERQQNRRQSDLPALLDLMKWQLANFDPVPVATGQGQEKRPLFVGDEHSMAFATDRSVKAISKGVPIIARYVYSQSAKKLYYSEIPLDPYHHDDIKAFLELAPGDKDAWPRFYETDAGGFALAFGGGEDKSDRSEAWDNDAEIPSVVTVKWSSTEGGGAGMEVMVPNFLFPASKKAAQKARSEGQTEVGAKGNKGNKGKTPNPKR